MSRRERKPLASKGQPLDDREIIVRGLTVSPGVAIGKVKVLSSPAELDRVAPADIVVVPNSHPSYAIALAVASGLICEVGGVLSHTCIVAMEMGIPCITQAVDATKVLRQEESVCLDANRGVVYGCR